MKWTYVVTRFHYWILGKNVDLSGSPSGCARRTPLAIVAFGVLSVWWKTSVSVNTLFRAVLPHASPVWCAWNSVEAGWQVWMSKLLIRPDVRMLAVFSFFDNWWRPRADVASCCGPLWCFRGQYQTSLRQEEGPAKHQMAQLIITIHLRSCLVLLPKLYTLSYRMLDTCIEY